VLKMLVLKVLGAQGWLLEVFRLVLPPQFMRGSGIP
jgi:hypothetical protein